MRVLVLGASGYIGKAVAKAFRSAGHRVIGMVRSKAKGQELSRHEIDPLIGDLADPTTFRQVLPAVETVVYCASPLDHQIEIDAIETVLQSFPSSKISSRSFLYTSGVWNFGNSGNVIVDEASPYQPIPYVQWRLEIEEYLLNSSHNARIAIISPGCVYGGGEGLTALWFESTQQDSVEVAGSGTNHWAMVHIDDLAKAYVLAAEKEIQKVVINVVDNTHYTVNEMALAVANAAGIPNKVHYLTEKEAIDKYGTLAQGLLVDQKVSNDRAHRLLGWLPLHKGFIEEIDCYYQTWKSYKTPECILK